MCARLFLFSLVLTICQAFLPDPDNCCKYVKVEGGTFTAEGRYHLDYYNGEKVLKKKDFWGVAIITYSGGRWYLSETGGGGDSYVSEPTDAMCPEDAGLLNGGFLGDVEIKCTLALPWWGILLICLGCAAFIIVILVWCCFRKKCCSKRRTRGRVVGQNEVLAMDSYPQQPAQVPAPYPPSHPGGPNVNQGFVHPATTYQPQATQPPPPYPATTYQPQATQPPPTYQATTYQAYPQVIVHQTPVKTEERTSDFVMTLAAGAILKDIFD